MVGKLGVVDLAALTFAHTLFYIPFIFGIGLLISISISSANALGAKDAAAARASCRHGFMIAMVLGLVLFLLSLACTPYLHLFGQTEEVTKRAPVFFLLIMASLIPALGSMALKNHADSLNCPWPSFWIYLGGVGLNIFLCWLLIYGNWGFPKLGLEGAGVATLIARIAILIGMIVWLKKSVRLAEWIPRRWLKAPDFKEVFRLCKLGTPSSLQLLTEVSSFSIAGLMMGRFGEVALGAHQIAITSAGVSFMVPVGICLAMTVRVGEARGANRLDQLWPIAWSGWIITGAFMIISMAIFAMLGERISYAYVTDAAVVALTTRLLLIVGAFQLFDGIQVCSSGILRGLGDVKSTAVYGFIGYICVGVPSAYLLAFHMMKKAEGVWWGLFAALVVAALLLTLRVWSQFKKVKHRSSINIG